MQAVKVHPKAVAAVAGVLLLLFLLLRSPPGAPGDIPEGVVQAKSDAVRWSKSSSVSSVALSCGYTRHCINLLVNRHFDTIRTACEKPKLVKTGGCTSLCQLKSAYSFEHRSAETSLNLCSCS